MAIGKASDFKVYQDQFQAGVIETLTQNAAAFNAASRGAISLGSISRRGDYSQQAFFKDVLNLVTRRDTTSVAAVTDLALTQDEWISVKLNRKIGPAAQTRDAFRKLAMGRTAEELSLILGQQAGVGMRVEMVNTALRAARAALAAQAAVTHTIATNGTMTTAALVSGLSKFGDAAERIVCWVMHSKVFYDLVQQQIAANIDGISSFNVAQASPVTLNRPVVIVDSPSLIVTGTPDLYHTLGLTASGVIVENTEEEELVVEDVTGLEQLIVRYQGEYAYNVGIKGFKWDITNGGANPLDAALGTATNWDTNRNSYKDFAGIDVVSG